MSQTFEDLQPLLDDLMRPLPLDIDDEPDAARIFLVLRIIEPLLERESWYVHGTCLVTLAGNYLENRTPIRGR